MPPTSSTHPRIATPAPTLDAPALDSRLLHRMALAVATLAGAAAQAAGGWMGLVPVVMAMLLLGGWFAGQPSATVRRLAKGRADGRRDNACAALVEPVVSRWQELLGKAQRTTHQHRRQLDNRLQSIGHQLQSLGRADERRHHSSSSHGGAPSMPADLGGGLGGWTHGVGASHERTNRVESTAASGSGSRRSQ